MLGIATLYSPISYIDRNSDVYKLEKNTEIL